MNGLVHCHAQKHSPLQGKTSPIQDENRHEGFGNISLSQYCPLWVVEYQPH